MLILFYFSKLSETKIARRTPNRNRKMINYNCLAHVAIMIMELQMSGTLYSNIKGKNDTKVAVT
jgi:hypothetical protein